MNTESKPLIVEMERRANRMDYAAHAFSVCADVFEQACTPRPPKAEWFKKWQHWSMKAQETNIFGRNAVVIDMPDDDALHAEYVQKASLCVPVSRDWPHALVGWQVVGE